ncbi:MAG: Stk1 family PASTA domain-containing Ser/Thr kinase [Oscillospiraceae bacterium]|jgi:serine/threonine-protein kinase|nr:Stk1 family PASTA domain-containing Ser/Thr kinase [Oscillospiraceae bacterium]
MDYYVGKILDGRYEIQEVLGIGGMAIVYRAYDNIDDRPVAVKILKEEFLANEEFRRRFKNESKAIAMLSHPNIVKVYDVSYGDRLQYIVMEYVEGITLKEYIEQQRVIPWKEAVHFLTQILRALQHAHDRGVVHRDIKPQNIMLLQSGNIKVTDFGIARFSRSETRTMTENAIGSVHYISPEQARGDFTDEKADLYSVGVVLYEMLTGQLPFQSDSTVSVAIMQLQSEARRPREINDTIPLGLEQITIRAMQKNPADRYQSAAEMLLDLEEFKRNPLIKFEYSYYVDREPTKYISPSDWQRTHRPAMPAAPAPAPAVAVQEPEEEEEEAKSRVVPIMTGIVVGLVILAAVITAMVLHFNSQSDKVEIPRFTNLSRKDIEDGVRTHRYDDFTFDYKEEVNNAVQVGYIIKQDPAPGKQEAKGDDGKVLVTLTISVSATKDVPKVAGLSYNDAKSTLMTAGFEVKQESEYSKDIKEGQVIRTEPAGGDQLKPGGLVTVYVCVKTNPQNQIEVPRLISWTVAEAKTMLADSGLLLDESNIQEVDSNEAKGKIVWQSIDQGVKVPGDTKISVRISNGKPAAQDLTINLQLPQGADGEEGTLRVFLNSEKKNELTVLLDGSVKTLTVSGAGAGQQLQVMLNNDTVYKATVDFTQKPPKLTNEQHMGGSSGGNTGTLGLLPRVIGKTKDAAVAALNDAGFMNVTFVTRSPTAIYPEGTVSGQDPTPLLPYSKDTMITLTVSQND